MMITVKEVKQLISSAVFVRPDSSPTPRDCTSPEESEGGNCAQIVAVSAELDKCRHSATMPGPLLPEGGRRLSPPRSTHISERPGERAHSRSLRYRQCTIGQSLGRYDLCLMTPPTEGSELRIGSCHRTGTRVLSQVGRVDVGGGHRCWRRAPGSVVTLVVH